MVVDLSVAIDERTPVYPGDPVISIQPHASSGPLLHQLQLGTHSGTHIDAPAHMLERGATLGELPLETFSGPGKLISTPNLSALEQAEVGEGDVVLFDTGAAERLYDASYFKDFPVLPLEVAEALVRLKVRMVGLDAPSADNDPEYPVHRALLMAGIPIIENLTNLSALKGRSFTVYAFPLKLDLDGAPVRAVAEVHDA